MIQCSLDWAERRSQINRQIGNVSRDPSLRKLLNTVDNLVRDLSRAEVIARRHNKEINSLPELAAVNAAIDNLEQWLVMAALLRKS